MTALDRQSGPRGSNSMVSGPPANTDRFLTRLGNNQHHDTRAAGGASRFFYCAKVSTAERNAGGVTNHHATLKPLALTTYLARLILPPPHIFSCLLVPFCGTGSEVAGALQAGWSHVIGIDNDPVSIDCAQSRIPGLMSTPPPSILRRREEEAVTAISAEDIKKIRDRVQRREEQE